jgi:putative ABC transport system permease protein
MTAPPNSKPGVLAARARQAAAAAPGTVRVLTGDGRADAQPDPDAGLLAIAAALLGTTSGLAGFVSVFVVAGTFAYAVTARRREFGLLRTAGATPRQVRRLVLGEALAVGVTASAAGSAAGPLVAAPFARWLVRAGLAPHTLSPHVMVWPLAAAAGAGVTIALTGAWVAARRTGKVQPAEALREAAVDRKVMPWLRWIAGLAALGGSVPLLLLLGSAPSAGTVALFLPIAMLLTTGCAMLAPLLIRPLVWMLALPLSGPRSSRPATTWPQPMRHRTASTTSRSSPFSALPCCTRASPSRTR